MKPYLSIAALGLSVGVFTCTSQAALQLQWTFDEASGNSLDTGAAPAADGTLQGEATRSSNTPSNVGSSIDFTGETTYAHVLGPDANKLDGLSTITISTWLNLAAYPSAPSSSNSRLVAKQAAGNFGGFSFSVNNTPNDGTLAANNFRLALFLGNNVSSGAADFGAAFSNVDADADNKWVFLAATYDNSLASGNTQFYIGGENTPVTALGTAQTLPQITIDGGGALFGVGYTDAAPTSNQSINGLQDDVRVYDQALDATALEAVRLANVPEPTSMALLGLGGLGLVARRRR